MNWILLVCIICLLFIIVLIQQLWNSYKSENYVFNKYNKYKIKGSTSSGYYYALVKIGTVLGIDQYGLFCKPNFIGNDSSTIKAEYLEWFEYKSDLEDLLKERHEQWLRIKKERKKKK